MLILFLFFDSCVVICVLLRMFLVIMCCCSYIYITKHTCDTLSSLIFYMGIFQTKVFAIHFHVVKPPYFSSSPYNSWEQINVCDVGVYECISENNNRETVMWCLWIYKMFMISCLMLWIYTSRQHYHLSLWIEMIFNIYIRIYNIP